MKVISHPERFCEGVRVLFLKGRNKDGVNDLRMIARITHTPEKFKTILAELVTLSRPGERIYASADARDIRAASRHFKIAQIEADFAGHTEDFYTHLQTRWTSSLMQPASRAEKNWLFDCDNEAMFTSLTNTLTTAGAEQYHYATKNGHHIITKPFDRRVLSAAESATLNDNPLMLWAYDDARLSRADDASGNRLSREPAEQDQGQGEKS